MKILPLQAMPSGEEWLILIGIAVVILLFIFKAGQWYGQSKSNKQK